MKEISRQGSAFIAPIVMSLVLPAVILWFEHQRAEYPLITPFLPAAILGGIILLVGLTMLLLTIRMLIQIGRGTIMPWDPTRKLVTASLYGYVRNPMILGVLLVQCGEAILFGSYGIAVLATVFFVINTIYFIYSEEPGLEKRFGQEYVEYKQNVPRWIPRLTPWHPK